MSMDLVFWVRSSSFLCEVVFVDISNVFTLFSKDEKNCCTADFLQNRNTFEAAARSTLSTEHSAKVLDLISHCTIALGTRIHELVETQYSTIRDDLSKAYEAAAKTSIEDMIEKTSDLMEEVAQQVVAVIGSPAAKQFKNRYKMHAAVSQVPRRTFADASTCLGTKVPSYFGGSMERVLKKAFR